MSSLSGEEEPRAGSLKRDHDSFQELKPETAGSIPAAQETLDQVKTQASNESLSTPAFNISTKREPTGCTLAGLASSTPPPGDSRDGPSSTVTDLTSTGANPPNATKTPTAASASADIDGSAVPPPKKPKISLQEKEMKKVQKEIKDTERAEEKARNEVEKEAKRMLQKLDRAAKEETKRKKADVLKRKEQSQLKLGNFFGIPTAAKKLRSNSVESGSGNSMSPAPTGLGALLGESVSTTPSKPQLCAYKKMFPEFFVQNNVTLAPQNRFQRDDKALESIQNTIDSYITGEQILGSNLEFDATALFHLPTHDSAARGRYFVPVRDIMNELLPASSKSVIDLTTDSQNTQLKKKRHLLKGIPSKFLKFQEDVRPPYQGTYTGRPLNGVSRLAKNPMRRDLPDTNYDYDSEAEWVEDEDGEDLKSEGGDEEEDGDEEDMDGFLDDEADEGRGERSVLQGDLEPISTGLCWEDRKMRNSHVKMMPYRLEFMLDSGMKSIDPFSTAYWESERKSGPTAMEPPRIPLKNTSINVNPPAKSFFTPTSELKPTLQQLPLHAQSPPNVLPILNSVSSTGSRAVGRPRKPSDPSAPPKKLVPIADMEAFRKEVEGSDLSKVGLIEVLKKRFPGRPAASIKNTLEVVARREVPGGGAGKERDKRWVLNTSS